MNSKYTVDKQGVFVVYFNDDYMENRRKHFLHNAHYTLAETPKYNEQSVYKLHISLSDESYSLYKNELREILLKYLSLGNIDSFKLTHESIIELALEDNKKFLNLLLEYEKFTDPPTKQWEYDYIQAAKLTLGHDGRKIHDKDIFTKILNYIKLKISDLNRFLHSDQITLYLPVTFQDENIMKLCREVNDYLTSKNATKGDIFEVECPVGEFINFRQEYLLADFEEAQKTGDVSKRIETRGKVDDETKRQVLFEQESSKLYQLLKNSIGVNRTPLRFFNPANYTSLPPSDGPDSGEQPKP